jgi:uncharacterized protein with HEPN domain
MVRTGKGCGLVTLKSKAAKTFEVRQLPPRPSVRYYLEHGQLSGRKTMSAAHQLELLGRYPVLFRLANQDAEATPEPFAVDGFTVGDGWFGIIDRLAGELSADPDLFVIQVKEKFGLLRVYLRADNRRSTRGHLTAPASGSPLLSVHFSPEMSGRLDAAMARAVEESRRTCEVCGKPGKLAERSRWLSVRCRPCAALDQIVRACGRLDNHLNKYTARGLRVVPRKKFERSDVLPDACRAEMVRMGKAARLQSARNRARLPAVDWRRLDQLRDASVRRMTAAEVYAFAKNEVPALVEALR